MTCDSLDAPGPRVTEGSPWRDRVFRMLTHFVHLFRTPGRRDGVGPPMAISPTVSIVECDPVRVRSKGPKKPMSSAHQDKPFENCDRNHNEMQAPLWFLRRVRWIFRLIHPHCRDPFNNRQTQPDAYPIEA